MGRGLLGCTCLTKHFNHLATKKKWSAKQSKSDLYTSLYILFGVVSFPHFPSSMQTAERWVHKLRTQRAGDESWTWGCKNPMKPLKFSIKIQIREPFNPIFKQKLRNYMKLHETTWNYMKRPVCSDSKRQKFIAQLGSSLELHVAPIPVAWHRWTKSLDKTMVHCNGGHTGAWKVKKFAAMDRGLSIHVVCPRIYVRAGSHRQTYHKITKCNIHFYIHTIPYQYTYTYTCTHTYPHTHIHTYTHTHIHTYIHTCLALRCVALRCVAFYCIAMHCMTWYVMTLR